MLLASAPTVSKTATDSGYGVGFNAGRRFSLSDGNGFGKNKIMFGADMSSYGHVDNRKKDLLIIGKDSTQRLDNIKLNAENEYAKTFSEKQKIFYLSLHDNGVNSYLLVVNCVEVCIFKAKDFEINAALLCLGNVSKDFSTDNMKKTGLYGYI